MFPIAILVLLALLTAVGCGSEPESPSEVVSLLMRALDDSDYGAVYDLLSVESQVQLDQALQKAARNLPDDEATAEGYGGSPQTLAGLRGRELFVRMLTADQPGARSAFVAPLLDADGAEIPRPVQLVAQPTFDDTGTRAEAVLKLSNGDEHLIHLIREQDRWALDTTGYCAVHRQRGGAGAFSLPVLAMLLVAVSWLYRRRLPQRKHV